MQIVVRVRPLRARPGDPLLSVRYRRFRAMDISLCDRDPADQRGYFPLLVRDLPFQSGLLRDRGFEIILVGTFIYLIQKFAFLHEFVVVHIQPDERAFNLWRHPDEIRKYLGVLSSWILVRVVENAGPKDHGSCHEDDAEPAAEELAQSRVLICLHTSLVLFQRTIASHNANARPAWGL